MTRAVALGICAGLFAGVGAGSAFAGDMALPAPATVADPAPATVPDPAPATVPYYKWKGFFIGGHLGDGWGSEPIVLTPDHFYSPFFTAGTIPRTIAADPRGLVGGVQYGTNWQFDRIVLGTESDFSFTGIHRSQTVVTTVTNTGEQKLPWFGTTRVRAGYTIRDNVLVYATVGLANGRAEVNFSGGPFGAVASPTKSLWGWAIGGGLEYGSGPWSAKIEYLHYDIGTLTFYTVDTSGGGPPGATITGSTKFTGDMVRAGANYRFDWTPWDLIFGR